MSLIITLIGYAIYGCIFGAATNAVVRNKGYQENWFWWGFFFGLIALLVALSKPDRNANRVYQTSSGTQGGAQSKTGGISENVESGQPTIRIVGKEIALSRVTPCKDFLAQTISYQENSLSVKLLPITTGEYKALNADIIFETLFGDKKELTDMYFTDFEDIGNKKRSSFVSSGLPDGFLQTVKTADMIVRRYVIGEETVVVSETELEDAQELRKRLFVESDELISILEQIESTYDMEGAAEQFYRENNLPANTDIMRILKNARLISKMYGNSDREKNRVLKEIRAIYYGEPTVDSNKTPQKREEVPAQRMEPNFRPRFCTNCGKPVVADAVFCGSCGSKL